MSVLPILCSNTLHYIGVHYTVLPANVTWSIAHTVLLACQYLVLIHHITDSYSDKNISDYEVAYYFVAIYMGLNLEQYNWQSPFTEQKRIRLSKLTPTPSLDLTLTPSYISATKRAEQAEIRRLANQTKAREDARLMPPP